MKEFFKTHSIVLIIVYLILLINNFILMMPILASLQIRSFDILGLILAITPSTILWALPFSTLLGTLLFIGRLVNDNEIMASACLGINRRQIIKPFLVYGFFIGIGSYMLDSTISPATNKLFKKIASRIVAAAPQVIIESESSLLLGDTLLITGPISQEGILEGITIIEKNSNDQTKVIHAKKGLLFKIKNHHESILNLKELRGIIASSDVDDTDYQLILADESLYRFNIKPSKLGVATTFSNKTLAQTLKNFIDSKKELKNSELNKIVQAKQWQDDLGDIYLEAYQYPQIANNELLQIFQKYKTSLEPRGFRLNFAIHAIELYQKISLIISSIIFILFAFTLAISRHKIQQTTIMAIGGILCVAYWFSYHLTISLILTYRFNSLVIASSDIVFLGTSLFLLRKVRL